MRAQPTALLPLVALSAALSASCENKIPDSPSLAATTPVSSTGRQVTEPAQPLATRLAFELVRLERRLRRPMPTPRRFRKQSCPDSSLLELSETKRTLLTKAQDARAVQRNLLPLRLTEQLSSKATQQLRGQLLSRAAPGRVGSPAARLSEGSTQRMLDQLQAFDQRRFLGVYHVVAYQKPRLIRRPRRRRREWVAGYLDAWLVIYDKTADEPVCQVRVTARNDTTEACISYRRRSQTRDQLIEQLGQLLRLRSATALQAITQQLRLAES